MIGILNFMIDATPVFQAVCITVIVMGLINLVVIYLSQFRGIKDVESIREPFHQTKEWFNEGWETDGEHPADDNYSVRADAREVTGALLSYMYENGYKIVRL